jgi:BolA family transcriptional regulator, general stress-responsive regulator
MNTKAKGPIEAEIIERLTAALSPTRLIVSNDSANHAGHMGDNGSGESHFSVEVECAAFAGLNRVARQRAVNTALGDLLSSGRVHALAIKAVVPDEKKAE